MEEESEKSASQKLAEGAQDVKDTVDGIKAGVADGAKLAKDVTTGNVFGVVKDGFKLLNNKTVRRMLIASILLPIIIIVMLASSLLGIFDTVGDKVKNLASNVYNFLISYDQKDNKLSIEIKEEEIDNIIKEIENLGIKLEDLNLAGDVDLDNADLNDVEKIKKAQEKAARKYIKAFLEAQLVTEMPSPDKDYILQKNQGNHDVNTNYVYGVLHVNRATGNNTSEELKFVENPDELLKAKYSNNIEKSKEYAAQHYSLNEEGIVVANITTKKVEINGKEDKSLEEIIITPITIPYKALVSQYSTSMQFLIYLTMVTQNPEFTYELSKIIKSSKIQLTIMDGENTNVEIDTYTYTKHTKTVTEKEIYATIDNTRVPTGKTELVTDTDEKEVTVETKTTTISTIRTAQITNVDTWFTKQDIEYTKVDTNTPENSYSIEDEEEMKDDEEPELEGEGSVTWNTGKTRTITEYSSNSSYELGTSEVTKESIDGKVDEFIKMLNTEYKIPKTTRKDAPGSNLEDGADWFFNLLQKDESSQNLEIWMRYMLYKYSGRDYGVKDIDPNMFALKEFKDVTGIYGGTIQEKVWFALKSIGISDVAAAAAMGNIHYESTSFNPEKIEGGYNEFNGGIGLCQWTNDGRGTTGRNQELRDYAASKGVTWHDEDTQVEFLISELSEKGIARPHAKDQLLASDGYYGEKYSKYSWRDVEEDESKLEYATKAFAATFERPGAKDFNSSMPERIKWAEHYYEQFKGMKSPTATSKDIEKYNLNIHNSYIEFKQVDYPHVLYNAMSATVNNRTTLANNGCLPTTIAIIASGRGVTDEFGNAYTPETLVKGGIIKGPSFYDDKVIKIFRLFNLTAGKPIYTSNSGAREDMLKKLNNGSALVIHANGENSYYTTSGGHYMALIDVRGNEVYLSNPSGNTNKNGESINGWINIDTLISRNIDWYAEISGYTKPKNMEAYATEIQKKIVEEAKKRDMLGTKQGECQAWVSRVYKKATGDQNSKCCAHAAGNTWGKSTDFSKIPIGACVYSDKSATGTKCGTHNWDAGHVGIYIGNGIIASNEGTITFKTFEQWKKNYNLTCWGWNGGKDYSK